jgi:hypothetical protein
LLTLALDRGGGVWIGLPGVCQIVSVASPGEIALALGFRAPLGKTAELHRTDITRIGRAVVIIAGRLAAVGIPLPSYLDAPDHFIPRFPALGDLLIGERSETRPMTRHGVQNRFGFACRIAHTENGPTGQITGVQIRQLVEWPTSKPVRVTQKQRYVNPVAIWDDFLVGVVEMIPTISISISHHHVLSSG